MAGNCKSTSSSNSFIDCGRCNAEENRKRHVKGNSDSGCIKIHSVEARYESMVRRMRVNKQWIKFANGGNMPAATNPVYNGEDVTMQAGFDTATAFVLQKQL